MFKVSLIVALALLVFSSAPPSTATADAYRPRQRRAAQKTPAAQKVAQKPAQKATQKGRARAARSCRLLGRRCR